MRVLSGEAWARIQRGEVRAGIKLLERARGLAEGPELSDLDRAEVVFRLAVARYLISSLSTAVGLFAEALALADRSELPSDMLRANVLTWRSRCYRRQRDYEAAREDVERALELAESMEDPKALGEAYFQASLVAERDGHWVLARTYAERAKAQYEELSDRMNVGRLLNNLGGLEFLLGKPEKAIASLREAFALSLEHGDDNDVATAVSSLAQVYLKTGDPVLAEEHARDALRRLEGREDRGRDRQRAARARSGAARPGATRRIRGDAGAGRGRAQPALVRPASRRGMAGAGRSRQPPRRRPPRGAVLYRRAAEALQDFRF